MIERAYYSDPGRRRKQNEDACALPSHGVDETRFGTLITIADGIGGLPGGGEASEEAVAHLQSLYYAALNTDNLPDRLRQCVEQVNALNRLAQRKLSPQKGHLTTLVAAVIQTDQIWVANVGDSRAYLATAANRELIQLTEDHSSHIRNVKVDLVSDTDLTSRDSGVITRAIGLQDDCQVDIYHYTWSPGDRLLLCSDGLSHLLPELIIPTILESLPAKASRDLVANAVETDGSDNCTAVVAAWLPFDSSGVEMVGSSVKANPSQALPLTPPTSAETGRQKKISPRIRPGTRLVLLGLLLGWLSAGLIAFMIVMSQMVQ